MIITEVETFWTRIPFDMGGKPAMMGGLNWQTMNTVWLRIGTDTGLSGWGEAFGHAASATTLTVLNTQLAPALLGQDAHSVSGLRERLGKAFHGFGRNGPHVFALSGLDIALWDLTGKSTGMPLWRLLGGGERKESLPAYASLLRYGDAGQVAAACERALGQGYRDIKLHEITVPEVAAARRAIGRAPLMVDTNCPWSVGEAIRFAKEVKEHDLTWLEEPVWPPGDHEGLAAVRREAGVPIAAGENAAGLYDFRAAFAAGAIDVAQPSVTKIGGISAMAEIAMIAREAGVRVVPHNAYFGAGYLASLHCAAAMTPDAPFERLFIDLEAHPYHDWVVAKNGRVRVPNGPGLGVDPDMAVLGRYLVAEPTLHRA